MKNIFIQILRVLMLFLLLISGVIGYIIYEDTLSEWWIPVGVALMIAVATFPFYMRWAWLTAGDNKIGTVVKFRHYESIGRLSR